MIETLRHIFMLKLWHFGVADRHKGIAIMKNDIPVLHGAGLLFPGPNRPLRMFSAQGNVSIAHTLLQPSRYNPLSITLKIM